MSKLREIFLKTGHIYISKKGYISIEIYSSDRMVCDYVARILGGRIQRQSKNTHKVAVHNRPALVRASHKLLEIVYDDKIEAQLRLVLEYAKASSKDARDDAATELSKLLMEEEE